MIETEPMIAASHSDKRHFYSREPGRKVKEPLAAAFFWLASFYFIYCARPEDWVKFLSYIPLAKISGTVALLSLLLAAGKTPRKFKDLPVEGSYLLALICIVLLSAFFSPVWRGGALVHAIDFAKVYVAWVLTYLLITTLSRLRRIVFIQACSVGIISGIAILKGHNVPRLNGVINGIYSSPNDLAFAIVLCIPLVLLFFVSAKGVMPKLFFVGLLLSLMTALVLTASRAGFIDLLVSGTVCLWYFGVKGRRFYLIVGVGVVGTILLFAAGNRLETRLASIVEGGSSDRFENSAYDSFEERKLLMQWAVQGVLHYPILGVGANDFGPYTGHWKEVHMSYLQIAVEGGIPALILYLLFFRRGFANLKALRKQRDLDPETQLFVGALHSVLIGFVLGACFAPEVYQFFPYFTVCYTSVLLAIVRERAAAKAPSPVLAAQTKSYWEIYGRKRPGTFIPAR